MRPRSVMAFSAHRGTIVFVAAMMLALVGAPLALAGCGATARVVKLVPLATATIHQRTVTPVRTTTALTTCQPDPGGIFAAQPSFVTLPAQGPIPSLPLTKRGTAASRYGNGVVTNSQGYCSLTTGPALDTYLARQLPGSGWQYGPPPGDLAGACGRTGSQWWQGSSLFQWSDQGDGGGGSFFWSYSLCAIGGA